MIIPAMMVTVLILIILLFVLYETRKVEICHYAVPVPQLPPDLESFRIAVIADIHYSPHMEESFLKKILSLVNEEKVDMVLLAGDLASSQPKWVLEIPELLSALTSRLGTYTVLGNHDYCYGRKPLIKQLQEKGITVLRNEHIQVGSEKDVIHLIGIDDPATFRDDIEGVLEGLPREGMRIAVCHSPDGIRPAIREKVPLIITGHTHGGQVRLPFIGPLFLPTREEREFDSGWFKQSQSWIYVSRGLGVASGIPLRILCPREIAVITLSASGSRVITTAKSV